MISLILQDGFENKRDIAILLRAHPDLCNEIVSGYVSLPEMTMRERLRLVHAFILLDPKMRDDGTRDNTTQYASQSFLRMLEYLMTNVTRADVKDYVNSYTGNAFLVHAVSSPLHVYALFLWLPSLLARHEDTRQDVLYDLMERIFYRFHILRPSVLHERGLQLAFRSGSYVPTEDMERVALVKPWDHVFARLCTLALDINSLPLLRYIMCELGPSRVPFDQVHSFMNSLGKASVTILRYILNFPDPLPLAVHNAGVGDWSRMMQGYLHKSDDGAELELVYAVAKRVFLTRVDAISTLTGLIQAMRFRSVGARRAMNFMRSDVLEELRYYRKHKSDEENENKHHFFWVHSMSELCDRGDESFLREFLTLYPGRNEQHAIDAIARHFANMRRPCPAADAHARDEDVKTIKVYVSNCEPQYNCVHVIIDAYNLDRSMIDDIQHV
eukprot:6201824-Pleurochrysis_carterae.AAC.2